MKSPEVSIVIPTKDRRDRLARTLVTAVAQQEVDAEVIIVDDGSRTPLGDTLRPGGAKIRVIRHESPKGVAEARNAGMDAARGAWLAFLDDDDLWAPEKLMRQLAAARQRQADYAFSNALVIDDSGTHVYSQPAPARSTDLRRQLLAANCVPGGGSNLIAKTTAIRSIGGFDPEVVPLEDWDLALRLSAGGSAAIIHEPLVAYVMHPANSWLHEDAAQHAYQRFADKHAAARNALGVSLDRSSWLRSRAFAHRRVGNRRRAIGTYWRGGCVYRDPAMLFRALVLALGGENAMAVLSSNRPLRRARYPDWLMDAVHPPMNARSTQP